MILTLFNAFFWQLSCQNHIWTRSPLLMCPSIMGSLGWFQNSSWVLPMITARLLVWRALTRMEIFNISSCQLLSQRPWEMLWLYLVTLPICTLHSEPSLVYADITDLGFTSVFDTFAKIPVKICPKEHLLLKFIKSTSRENAKVPLGLARFPIIASIYFGQRRSVCLQFWLQW